MKKIFVCFLSLLMVVLLYVAAAAFSSGNRYGGSTSHSYGSTSHTSAGKAPLIPTRMAVAQRTTPEGAGRRPALTAGRPTATLTTAVHTIIRLLRSIQRTIRPPR
jgi:hypothetical protein